MAAPVLSQRTGPVVVTGRLIKVERRDRDVRLLFGHVDLLGLAAEHTPTRVRVVARAVPADILPGHWLRVPAVLMPPPRPARPDGFDFARMAWFMQLGGVGYAVGRAERVPAPTGAEAWSPVIRLNALRQQLSDRIRAQLPGPTGAVAAALITGDRGAIPKDSVEAMRVSGLAHLLAISGLHIGLVAGTIFFAVRLGLALVEPVALRYPIKKWAALAALLGAFGYLLLSGATVPTQRAFLMAALALGAVLIDRNPISMRLVAFAAIIVLLAQPESLLGASFQMSFAAVLALVAVYEHAGAALAQRRRRLGWSGRLLLYLAAVLLTTLVASVATGPFAAYHFHRVASYGLLANLVAVPVMAIWIMPCAVLVLVLTPLGLDAAPLWLMGQGIDLVLAWAHGIAELPAAVRRVPAVPVAALLLCVAGGLWLCLWRGRGRSAGVLPLAAAIVVAVLAPQPDMLVSEDGRLLAVRVGGEVVVSGNRSRRSLDRWLDAWAIAPTQVRRAGSQTPLRCDAIGCIVTMGGRRIAFARDGRALIDDCRTADLVIASVPARRYCRDNGVTVIDRFDLWRDGAHALWLQRGGMRVSTVARVQGARPWAPMRGRSGNVAGRRQ